MSEKENKKNSKISKEDKENQKEAQEETPKKKTDAYFEMLLIFVLGFLLGMVLKTEAVKNFTIGYDDPSVVSQVQSYKIDQLEKELMATEEEVSEEAVETEVIEEEGEAMEGEDNNN